MSVHQKETQTSKKPCFFSFLFSTVFLLGVRKINSRNSSLENIACDPGSCNYILSFEIKALAIAVCLAFCRMNHVSSLGIHYKCKVLLRLIVVSRSALKSSGGGLHWKCYEDSLENTVCITHLNGRNHVAHTVPSDTTPLEGKEKKSLRNDEAEASSDIWCLEQDPSYVMGAGQGWQGPYSCVPAMVLKEKCWQPSMSLARLRSKTLWGCTGS